ncbi:bifunctional diguanylate cyclase/phosphodiesterase [Accumulibacter sp.]|uniref:putative bifunctional diguanylate cyclase/phosphodiesterase n=1 Tax=Accumulibacter sp. TaxID=2053492 RepID=UPI0025D7B4A6|nr:bifunctional diguanylate cyclase/phosphodiesterase [Accumulibacter sp.]MCP5229832.1 EAL domain-containing protein [Accumulibacter sp.]
MATRQGNRDDPGQGLALALCDFELAARLHEALVGDERQPPGDAIAALLREALCSAEACFVWAEQLAEVGGVWAELFSAARTRGRLAHCRATPGNRHPDHLALPVLCGEQLLALVGVGGAAGGYDRVAVRRFAGLAVLLAGLLQTRARQKQGLAALAVSADKLRLNARILERSNDAVLVTDADEQILACNHAFSRITGYAEQDLVGKSPAILFKEDGEAQLRLLICEQIACGGEWHGELQFTRKNGEQFPAWTAIGAVAGTSDRRDQRFFVFSDISERKQAERQIHRLAHYDALTALPNRGLFNSLLEQALSAALRKRTHGALLYVDLNRFKHINESFGHAQADSVLTEVARRLAAVLRDEDVVARLGGDEFVIALPDISRREHAGHVAKKVLASLAQPFFLEEHEILLSASIGISIFPDDGRDAGTLLQNADVAMARAKKRGSSAHLFYSQEMNQRSFEHLKLEGGLRRAIERDELYLVYQPQLDLNSGRITGAEALLRWQHPERGLISPAQFIPVAEETGLIIPIGEWVINAACGQIREWIDKRLPGVRVAVNLSARQFSASLPRKVVGLIARHAIPSSFLELEITESMLVHSADSVVSMMRDFGEAGILMTLDDFGTGYSSLSYLKRFPIDTLKIDQSFVRGIPGDKDDSSIARTIISMAKNLGLSVIAEGVENAAQMQFLRGAGCEEIQGYYFSRPLAAESFAELLLQTNGCAPASA